MKLELSTSTNLVAFIGDSDRLPIVDCIRILADGGFQVIDINWCEAMNPCSRLRDDNWQAYVEEIAKLGEELDLTYNQSHLPYYDIYRTKDSSKATLMEKLIERTIIANSILKIPWAVTHPFTCYGESMQVSKERNLAYYSRHLETAASYGVGIALENDFVNPREPEMPIYCSQIEELIDLVDAFACESVGICYDFGHANLMGANPREDLHKIGQRLKAIHIADNRGKEDEHILPFYGTVNWKEAMAGLRDIAYTKALTFEAQQFGRYYPKEAKALVVQHSLAVGRILQAYYQGV